MLARSNPEQKPDAVFPDMMELQFWFRGSSHLFTTAVRSHPNDDLCICMRAIGSHTTATAMNHPGEKWNLKLKLSFLVRRMSHMIGRIKAGLTCTVHGNTLSGSGGGPHLFWSWSHWLWSGTAKQRVAVVQDVTLRVILKGDFRLNEESCGRHEAIPWAYIITWRCRCLKYRTLWYTSQRRRPTGKQRFWEKICDSAWI